MRDKKINASRACALLSFLAVGIAEAASPPPPPPPPGNYAPQPNYAPQQYAPICRECGVIESIRQVQIEGHSSGAGMIIGGILGGVLGHQIGGGRGKDVATVAGAAGGAYAGNQIEKSNNRAVRYEISVRMDDGRREVIRVQDPAGWRNNDRVRVTNGHLSLISQ